MKKSKLTVKDGPGLQSLKRLVSNLDSHKVLIGIPDSKDARSEGGIGNAGILYIAENGSPSRNIPPWPVLSIGMNESRDACIAQMKSAVQAASNGKKIDGAVVMQRVGMIAVAGVKNVIDQQVGAPPLADSTLAGRARRGFLGTSRLIVTGQLRNAITYVVKGK